MERWKSRCACSFDGESGRSYAPASRSYCLSVEIDGTKERAGHGLRFYHALRARQSLRAISKIAVSRLAETIRSLNRAPSLLNQIDFPRAARQEFGMNARLM